MTPTIIIQGFNPIQNISPRKTSARTEKTVISPLERSEKDLVLPKRNSGSETRAVELKKVVKKQERYTLPVLSILNTSHSPKILAIKNPRVPRRGAPQSKGFIFV